MIETLRTDDGEHIHIKISGAGSPIVLLHEWAADHRLWDVVAEKLEARFTIYRWDARGHGGHSLLGAQLPTVQRMAEDLHQLIIQFELRNPVLVGHSMGALTIWEMLRQYGCEGVSKLCIIDQSPKLVTGVDWSLGIYGDFSESYSRVFSARLRNDFAETVLGLIAQGKNRRARQLYRQNSTGFQRLRERLQALEKAPLIACWNSLTQTDYRSLLPRITLPTLLVFGAESNYYGEQTGIYLRDVIPDAKLHVYAGADHSPHLANRDRFIKDLSEFIDQ